MTRDALIKRMQNAIDGSGSLPITLGEDEITRIIEDEETWFYENYKDSVTQQWLYVKGTHFVSQDFKKNRAVQLPDCIVSVYDAREVGHGFGYGFADGDFSLDKFMLADAYLGPFASDEILLLTAKMSFADLSRAFSNEFITFDWNRNMHQLKIVGRTPNTDLALNSFMKIPREALYEDIYFRKVLEGKCRIALGELLQTYTFNLGGGVTLNPDALISRGESLVEEWMQRIDDENTPTDYMYYH